jgi:hypothetical protein
MFLMTQQPCREQTPEVHEIGTLARSCDACLEYLNACRTLVTIRYDHEGKLDSDMQKGVIGHVPRFVHEYSLLELFTFMKRMEMLSAETSYLYNMKLIRDKVTDPDIIKRKRDPQEFQKAIQESKMAQRPEKEKKQLSAREKAIDALVKVGLPLEMATASVDEQFKKQGKVTA